MGEAYFDSKPIGLWNFREIEGDCKGCTVRLVKRRALLTSFWPVHHKSFNFIVQCFTSPARRDQELVLSEQARAGVWTVSVYYHVDTDGLVCGQTLTAGMRGGAVWKRLPLPRAPRRKL